MNAAHLLLPNLVAASLLASPRPFTRSSISLVSSAPFRVVSRGGKISPGRFGARYTVVGVFENPRGSYLFEFLEDIKGELILCCGPLPRDPGALVESGFNEGVVGLAEPRVVPPGFEGCDMLKLVVMMLSFVRENALVGRIYI